MAGKTRLLIQTTTIVGSIARVLAVKFYRSAQSSHGKKGNIGSKYFINPSDIFLQEGGLGRHPPFHFRLPFG